MRQTLRPRDDYTPFGYGKPKSTECYHPEGSYSTHSLPNARLWKHSVYHYWWLFLRENDGYRNCCRTDGRGDYELLYKDFDDVHAYGFSVWWQKIGLKIFCEGENFQHKRFDSPDIPGPSDNLLPRCKLEQANSESLFSRDGSGHASKPRYFPVGSPNLKLLNQRYRLLILLQTRPELPLWRILDLSEGRSSGGLQGVEERGQKSMVAHRYYREALCIVDYAGRACFLCGSQVKSNSHLNRGKGIIIG